MNVHLIQSTELNKELFTRVIDLLQAVPGVNKFHAGAHGPINLAELNQEELWIPDKAQFDKKTVVQSMESPAKMSPARRIFNFPMRRPVLRWRDIFYEVNQYRRRFEISADELTILLTPIANKKNWFALLDQDMPYNGFIHTDDWEFFIPCDPAFPIAFEVMALILQKHIFRDYSEIERLTHERAIGCVSDLCMKKSDIILKMRTADICPECMKRVESHLSMPEIHHALAIMESLRVKMLYAQNFKQNSPPSTLTIRRGGRIYLSDYGNIEIKMPSLEKALYLLYLKYPEGLYLTELCDHRPELYEIYSQISTRGLMEDMRRRVDEMTNITRDQLSIKISRIKKAFTDAIGQSLAGHYIIQGKNAEKKKINLERELVEWKKKN